MQIFVYFFNNDEKSSKASNFTAWWEAGIMSWGSPGALKIRDCQQTHNRWASWNTLGYK